jgi:hypothetical protein
MIPLGCCYHEFAVLALLGAQLSLLANGVLESLPSGTSSSTADAVSVSFSGLELITLLLLPSRWLILCVKALILSLRPLVTPLELFLRLLPPPLPMSWWLVDGRCSGILSLRRASERPRPLLDVGRKMSMPKP